MPIDGSFFQTFVTYPGRIRLLCRVLVGPPLVSRDLRNNALPLYLCRPFSRAEYVIGKMSVVLILIVGDHLDAGMLLFLFQSYLEGFEWFARTCGLRMRS